jgi:para-aminobenzoate synthetase component 1
VYAVEVGPSPEAVIAAVAGRRDPAILDSADAGPGRGRFTIVAVDPIEVASWADAAPAAMARAGQAEPPDDPFEGMRQRLVRTRIETGQSGREVDLDGRRFLGWIGYFAYEAGRFIERLPCSTRADVGLPVARFGLYDSAAVYDAANGKWMIALADLPESREPAGVRLERWRAWLAQAARETGQTPGIMASPDAPPPSAALQPPAATPAPAAYLEGVRRIREYIAAGDVFQVNLARRETFPQREPAWRSYLRLRRVNPAAYAAYLAWRQGDATAAVLCASPELFLRLEGREVMSRPIKGTRPRTGLPAADQAAAAELAASAKDYAELAMIVDLVRNDLGRVCEYGSVRVEARDGSRAGPYELEAHPTVYHLVGTVTGRLAPGRDAIDLLRACFPGGSITGAPKVRAMEIIDELEPSERGVYTGSIGIFGLDGSMTLNIAIRTIIAAGGRLHVYAGGGIVADSVPEDELEETRAKARGMRRALGVE